MYNTITGRTQVWEVITTKIRIIIKNHILHDLTTDYEFGNYTK